jgi:arginase/N-omega-hydroxy-L-arginine amidinohydrolase
LSINLIVSQGRVGDKTQQTIKGALLTAKALEKKYGVKARSIGKFYTPENDDWSVSLPQARETLNELKQAVESSIQKQGLTLLASNTCSASLASLPVVAKHHPDALLLWIDAHGDFNTPETSSTGYLGGMVLSAVCGVWDSGHGSGVRSEQVVLVGAHDIDYKERELLRQSGVRIIPPKEVNSEAVLEAVGNSKIWIHIDWDVMDPGCIPADYQVSGGLLLEQIQEVFSALPKNQILGIELAEFHVPTDEKSTTKAISNILDIIAPILE